MFTSGPCGHSEDTDCTPCAECPDGEFIIQKCESGNDYQKGSDTMCADCAPPEEGFWEVSPCVSSTDSDAIYVECSQCHDGEYQLLECGATHDTVCPRCTEIDNCKDWKEICTNAEDQTCSECEDGYC